MNLAAGWIALLFWFFGTLYKPCANHRHARMALVMLGGHSVWLTPISRGRVSHSDSGLNTVGGVLACPWFVNDWHSLRIMPLNNVEKNKLHQLIKLNTWVHLKKFFLKNMCHTGTYNGGKKWRMVLFQVDPYIESPWTSIYCKFKVMQVIFYISHNSLKKSEIFIWRLWLPLLSLMGLSLSFAIGGNGQGCLMAIQYRWMSLRRGYHIR